MRKLSGLLLAATLVLSAPAMGQEEPRSSPWAQWLQWLFGLPADESPVTVAHPRALGLAAADQAREGRLQRNWLGRQFSEDKAHFLRQYQIETDRQVAGAMAKKAPAPPFRPPQLPPSSTSPPTLSKASTATDRTFVPSEPPPASVPRSTPKPTGPGPETAAIAERIVNKIINRPAAAPPLPPGLFVLALVGVFVVPATGAALVLIGLSHLRGHNFFSGSVITLLGGLVLWGTIALATRINPDLVAGTSDNANDASEVEGAVTPMDALRSGILWSSQ